MIHFPQFWMTTHTSSSANSALQNVPDLSSAIKILKSQQPQSTKLPILINTLEQYEQEKNQIPTERYAAQAPRILEMTRHILAHLDEIPQENIKLFQTCLSKGYVLEFDNLQYLHQQPFPDVLVSLVQTLPDGFSWMGSLYTLRLVNKFSNNALDCGVFIRKTRTINISLANTIGNKNSRALNTLDQTALKIVFLEELLHAFHAECEQHHYDHFPEGDCCTSTSHYDLFRSLFDLVHEVLKEKK